MKLEVLVHGVDVVKDVVGDARDDSHQLVVVQFTLNTAENIAVLKLHLKASKNTKYISSIGYNVAAKTCQTLNLLEGSFKGLKSGLNVKTVKQRVSSRTQRSIQRIKKRL